MPNENEIHGAPSATTTSTQSVLLLEVEDQVHAKRRTCAPTQIADLGPQLRRRYVRRAQCPKPAGLRDGECQFWGNAATGSQA
jgi:hypothetical protein